MSLGVYNSIYYLVENRRNLVEKTMDLAKNT